MPLSFTCAISSLSRLFFRKLITSVCFEITLSLSVNNSLSVSTFSLSEVIKAFCPIISTSLSAISFCNLSKLFLLLTSIASLLVLSVGEFESAHYSTMALWIHKQTSYRFWQSKIGTTTMLVVLSTCNLYFLGYSLEY